MCGINGIFAYHYAANPVDRAELVRTRDHMAARGPDGRASGSPRRPGRLRPPPPVDHRSLGRARSRWRAPTASSSSRSTARSTTTGSCAANSRPKGTRFRSQSDTEVLLHLYAEKGEAMVQELRGMFAFAIWDASARALFLARDPYGIKPLYYADDGWTFRFASQVKALLAGGAVSRDAGARRVVGLLSVRQRARALHDRIATIRRCRPVDADGRSHRGARAARAIHSIAAGLSRGRARHARHGCATPSRPQIARGACSTAFAHHLVADVPVGAFLSAGIDSGALVGLMRDAGQSEIETVTLRSRNSAGSADDEAPLAAEVARTYGTRHTTRIVTKAEFEADLPRILDAMDQPSIDGINTWFVAKAARERGLKVALSGLGGDELFGGYPSFRDVPRWVGALLRCRRRIPGLGGLVRRVGSGRRSRRSRFIPRPPACWSTAAPVAGAYLLRRGLFMPWELDGVLDRELVARGSCAGLSRSRSHRARARGRAPAARLRAGRGARDLALHAQPAAARHRLGQHGALP